MRLKRLKTNFIAAICNKGITALEQVILVPVFLSQWGGEYYGSWLVLVAIPTMLAMSNLGLGTAAHTHIVLALGKDDHGEANAAFVTANSLNIIIYTIIVLGLVFAYDFIFTLDSKFPIQIPNIILALLMTSNGLVALTIPLDGYWVAQDRAATAMFVRAGFSLVKMFSTAIIVFCGYSAFAVALGICTVGLVWSILFFMISGKIIQWRYSFQFTPMLVKSLVGKGVGYQSSALWQAILFQGSIWLANTLLGPLAAATWGTLRTLSRSGNQLLALINTSIRPEIQNSIARGYWKDAQRLHSASIIMSFMIATAAAIGLTCAGQWLYTWWTQGELVVSIWVWPILSIGIILNATWTSSEIVHIAFNQPWRINLLGIFSAVTAIFIMAICSEIVSTIDVFVFGSLVFDAIMAGFVLRRSLKLLQDNFFHCIHSGCITLRRVIINLIPFEKAE